MAIQLSDSVRNARLNTIETTIGASPTLEIRSGAAPANCAAADSGTLLVSMALPADYFSAAAGGAMAKLGTWQDASADGTGTAGHFRIKQGATCHLQGTVTATGGGGDLTLDSVAITATQNVTITSFTLTDANA